MELPVIDWALGLKLSGNNRELAEEMLMMLTKHLADESKHIRDAYDKKNYPELSRRIHKLHGAVSYCGTPRLKQVILMLEKSLLRGEIDIIHPLFEKFEMECQLVLERQWST